MAHTMYVQHLTQLYADELNHILLYLEARFGYVVQLFVCHSRGCAIAYSTISKHLTQNGRRPPTHMVMFSARFHLIVRFLFPLTQRALELREKFEPMFQEKGYAELRFPARGGNRIVRLSPQDFLDGCVFPLPDHVRRVPASVQVFVIHGTDDKIVPMVDSSEFVNVFTAQPTRRPGTVELYLLEGCDHNYLGKFRPMVTERTMQWINTHMPPAPAPPPAMPLQTVQGSPEARGALIVVEGLDRAGKSTQVARLAELLQARLVKFPDRTTQIGTMINAYLTHASEIPDEAIHLLFSANRWEVIGSIERTLAAGQSVVCDRYAFSGIAYSRAKGLDLTWCLGPDVGIPMPDLTLFLDLDEATAAARSAYGEERYEKQTFQRAVRQTFMDVELLVQQAGGAWTRLDARGSPDDVFASVRAAALEAVQRVQRESFALRPLQFDMTRSSMRYSQQRPSL